MYRARYSEGRGQFLRAFRIHIFSKPSPAMIDFWMKERVAQFRQDADNAHHNPCRQERDLRAIQLWTVPVRELQPDLRIYRFFGAPALC